MVQDTTHAWCKTALVHDAQQAVLACAARASLAHKCNALIMALFLVSRVQMPAVTPLHEGKMPVTALASAVHVYAYNATDITKATGSQIQHIPWPRFQQFWLLRQHSLPQWLPSP